MTVNAITDTKKGRTGIAPTYLHTTRRMFFWEHRYMYHSPNGLNLIDRKKARKLRPLPRISSKITENKTALV